MRASLIAVGSGMPDWVEAGFAEYRKRLSAWLPLELVEVAAGARGKGRSTARAMADEATRLRAAVPRGARVVLLDSRGRAHSSEALATRLEAWRMDGRDLALLVGGPEGFDEGLRAEADEAWSLGPMTLPHPLVRIVVAEQLYRAASLVAGHPYHRG